MNSIAILRSIPLAQETRLAWASTGARVIPRKRIDDYVTGRRTEDDTLFINLGIRRHIVQANVINPLEVIQHVSRPTDIRETLGQYLPRRPEPGEEAWIKGHGWGGSGKVRVASYEPDHYLDHELSYVDYQLHVRGDEYRVNTVGQRIVQAHRKDGHDDWEWCGLQGIRTNGIIPLLKEAIASIPHGDASLIGWDVIVSDDKPYILEANTSPGVNEATARRIINVLVDDYKREPATIS